MSEPGTSRAGWRLPLLGAGAATLLVAGLLLAQHLRHGWPFSLHHRAPALAAEAAPPIRDAAARVSLALDDAAASRAGIALEPARLETIAPALRVAATVVPDEARIVHLHARIAGWLETLHVTTTGEAVRAGQPLAGIYSQELYASQLEYLAARRASAERPASAVVAGARARLAAQGMGEAEIRSIEQSGAARRLVTLSAPRAGVVLRRPVAPGTAVDPATEILTLADLSRVWAIAEVPEAEAASIAVGEVARLRFEGSGLAPREARVEFVAPTLSERTRTVKVRFGLDNARGELRPGLYGTAEFAVRPRSVLTVPRDAVVDTGERQHVFVAAGAGRLEPRQVTLGARLAERVEIREGLAPGEAVVVAGVFLVDSESRLRASGGAHAHGAAPEAAAEAAPPADAHGGH